MQDLYVPAATTGKGTASASGELARPAFLDIAKQNRAQTTIEDFLEFCADDAVTMLCAATTYLCEKYPKAYPEPVMLLRKAIKRVSPNKVDPYFRTTAKVVCRRPNLPNISVGTQEGMGGTPSPSPRKARRIKRSVSGRNTSTSLNQLDHAVHHPTLVAKESPASRGATPLSYQRTAAKASVTNELDGWQRDRNIQAWLRERKRKERFRNRMAEERNRNDKEWLDESKERMVRWYGKQGEKIQARAARSFSQTMNQMNQNLAAAKDSPRVKDSPRPSSRASPPPRTVTEHLRGDPIVPATV